MKTNVRALVDGYDHFIGIDHHKRTSYVTIKDREGEIVKKGGIVSTKASIADFIEAIPCDGDDLEVPRRIAVIECGRTYRPMYRWLSEIVDDVVLAHPGGLKIISDTVYKDDKIDSGKLSDLLMLGMIPEAHAASDEAWERRMVLRHRIMLVKMQTEVKNRIHVVVDLHPDALPRRPDVTDMFGKLGTAWLESLKIPDSDRRRLDELLEILEFLGAMIKKSDSLVRKMVREDKTCSLLKTTPGIGDFYAALIAAEIDDIDRFRGPKNFVSYTGLVPGRDSSGGKESSGSIHKRGNKYLRWALVEAAIPATRSDLALKNKYDSVVARKGGGKDAKKLAKVAVAGKLAWIVYRVLKDRRPYEIR